MGKSITNKINFAILAGFQVEEGMR